MAAMDAGLVRQATRNDAEPIARVHVDAWRETYTGMVPDSFFTEDAFRYRVEMWTRILSSDPVPGRLAVAERDGEVVGFANSGNAVGPDAEHGFAAARSLHLFSIYVLAAQHGSGLGQSLLDAVIADQPAQLWVAQANTRAIAFYTRNGFAPDGVQVVDPRLPDLVEIRLVR